MSYVGSTRYGRWKSKSGALGIAEDSVGMRNGVGNGVSRAFFPTLIHACRGNPWAKCELSDRRVRAGV